MADTKKVLIAEDDGDFAGTLLTILKLRKHQPFVANNGLEALNLAQQHSFDTCFLDVKMPVMGGIECLRELRKILPAVTTFVIMTGFRDEETMTAAAQAGADRILLKPFPMSDFVKLVETKGQ